ncbi:unnamed protein product, partial [Mesorhabditis belari]|uniref:diphosphoinositol-polyphosphate diphosphatase n=1 Tax=Mesorhabditis belari TaxID=2138241 RepID=A0AAF3ER84_9BILA
MDESLIASTSSLSSSSSSTISSTICGGKPLWKQSKHNGERLLDRDGYRQRAAALCLRRGQKSIEVLLINGGTEGEWVVPGGGVERAESPLDAAVRELEEEAGVRGDVLGTIGVFEEGHRKRRSSLVVLSPKEELKVWEEGALGRQRRWMSMDEAILLVKDSHKPILQAIPYN